MNQNKEFYDEIINAIREEIPEEIRDMMEVDIREIVKANDTVLHGVVIKAPEQAIVPTIYIEDCIKQLLHLVKEPKNPKQGTYITQNRKLIERHQVARSAGNRKQAEAAKKQGLKMHERTKQAFVSHRLLKKAVALTQEEHIAQHLQKQPVIRPEHDGKKHEQEQ